jgi:TPR repeat protein
MISSSLFRPRVVWIAGLLLTSAVVSAQQKSPEADFQAWLSEAQKGNVESMRNLGSCYLAGLGTKQDMAAGLKWLRQAADGGDKEALLRLGDAYFNGAPQADHAQALTWYRKAAEQGNGEAYRDIADYYRRGDGVKKDPAEMVKAYRQAIAAEDTLSLLELGKLFAEGKEVPQDVGEAGRLLSRAAFVGVPFAPEAYQALKTANPDLAEKVATTSEPETRALYTRAKAGDAAAMYAISEKFGAGEGGLSKDDDDSFIWLEKSAQAGYPTAQAEYSKTLGYRGRREDSLTWAKKAADQKDHEGEYLVGQHYEEGRGVEKSSTEAIKWYRLAAEAGHANAMRSLGMLLAQSKDYAGARTWLAKAKAGGDNLSGEMLAQLPSAETPSAPTATSSGGQTPAGNPVPVAVVLPPALTRAQRLFEVAYDNGGSDYERFVAWKSFLDVVAAAISANTFSKRAGTEFALKPLLARLEKAPDATYLFIAEINSSRFDLQAFREMASQPVRDAAKREADAIVKNFEPAREFRISQKALFDRAEAGDANAEYQAGALYASNALIHDQQRALDWIGKAAAHGHKGAKELMQNLRAEAFNAGGAALKNGNSLLALAKYQYAVKLGEPDAILGIGYIQSRGYDDVPPDPVAAMKSYHTAAEAGVTAAMLTIGEAYLTGDGVKADPAEGMRWIRRAADADNHEAQVRLADRYLWGKNVDKSATEALVWYRKAAGGDFGAAQMVILLDNCHTDAERQAMALAYACNAITLDHEINASLAWLEDAARFGFAPATEWVAAQDKLGDDHPEEETRQLANKALEAKNYDEAIRLWRKAADAGNRWAMVALGSTYAHGNAGLTEDHAEARRWYEKAGAGGGLIGRIAIWDMDSGNLVDEGVAAFQANRYDEARDKFEKAMAMGHSLGFLNLGLLNENGNGMPVNMARAVSLYTLASALDAKYAEDYKVRATSRLIQRPVLEQGMKLIAAQDFVQAKGVLQAPADAGNPEAMTNLGYVYENLPAGAADEAQAEAWYEKAIALKYPPASEMLRRLKAKQAPKAGK